VRTVEIFAVGGVRLAATVSGPAGARPLLLLHPGGGDRTSWDGVLPAFAQTHRVYAVDLRGFGDSDRPGAYSFELMRDDVLGLIDLLGAGAVDLIGHSMGGTVAWLVAELEPERVAHLVVEDTLPPKRGAYGGPVPDRPPVEPPFDWDALAAVLAQLVDPDPHWWSRIADVTSPTLVLGGGPASQVPQELIAQALELLPHGRLVEIPVGHQIHREATEEFLAAVQPFLRG
jgi:3-oxoadipate enol-lactonase